LSICMVISLGEWVYKVMQKKNCDTIQAQVLENAPVIIALHDTRQKILWANRAYREATGLSLEEMKGTQCHLVWKLRERCSNCPVTTALETGRFAEAELIPETQKNWPKSQGYWLSRAMPIKDEQGRTIGVVEAAFEITERKKAELGRLKESEDRYRNIFEEAGEGIFLMDSEGHIRDCNPAACNMLGYQPEELLQLRMTDLISPADLAQSSCVTDDSFQKTSVRIERELLCKDKSRRSTEEILVRLHTGEYLAMFRDITERKQAEEERENLQKQLLQAQKMDSIGRLAGGVAHDLNNMLLVILGYGDLMLADPELDPEQKNIAELIHRASVRCRNMVQQLLAFSRRQTLKMENLDVNQVLSDFEVFLHKTIREDITINFKPGADLQAIRADRTQLEQIILNLAINAQDAMPWGGAITIETHAADLTNMHAANQLELEPGNYILLIFNDTGQGMDKETQDNIFEPFFTTKVSGSGTGLGLASVYGIVKQHQGNILVSSQPGQGTTFTIYLPANENIQANERSFTKEQRSIRGQRNILGQDLRGQETVLVVEDDDMVQELTVKVLQDSGYNVLCASSGAECLELLSKYRHSLDLLLTDVVIPDMDGKTLYDQVVQSFPALKVIYMSGYTKAFISQHGVLDEGVAFIQKPFSVQDLCARVRGVLDEK
ncbi:MAG: PAS domain S-box protein, partial [Desulfovermiculus sp.]